jgi:hypothetical protein
MTDDIHAGPKLGQWYAKVKIGMPGAAKFTRWRVKIYQGEGDFRADLRPSDAKANKTDLL